MASTSPGQLRSIDKTLQAPGSFYEAPLIVASALICSAGVAVYANSFSAPFIFDDGPAILKNPTIRSLWPLWDTLAPPQGTGLTVEGRPILNLSLALNHALSGERVWSYHAINLAIHIAAALALFGVLRRTLALGGMQDAAILLASIATALWTVHPLHTESVTYVIQRAESLMGLFYLLTVYCFIRWTVPAARPHRNAADAWAWLSVVCCLFGMATKEVMVSAPFVILLYDRTFVAGDFREALRRRWQYYCPLMAADSALIWLALARTRGGTLGFGIDVTPWQFSKTQFQAIAHYLWLSFWPHPLIFDYGVRWTEGVSDYLPYAVWVGALLTVAAVGVFWPRAKLGVFPVRALGFAGVWFFAILAPTSSIVPGNRQTLAEHRMYLSLAAVIAPVVAGGYALCRRTGGRPLGLAWITAMVAATVGLGLVTVRRNQDYQSELVLYRDTVAKRPENAFAHYNLGKMLDESGSPIEALVEYRAALRYAPNMAEANYNCGNSLYHLGRNAEAVEQYQAAIRANPNFAMAHYNLGKVLVELRRFEDAGNQFHSAIRLKPDYVEAYDNLGVVLLRLGHPADAEHQLREVLRLNPSKFETYYNLGTALLFQHRPAEAISEYERVLQMKPDFPPAMERLEDARRMLAH